MKPHIRLIRNHWWIFKNRASQIPIGVTSRFRKLPHIGPWRPSEIACYWYGDSKPT